MRFRYSLHAAAFVSRDDAISSSAAHAQTSGACMTDPRLSMAARQFMPAAPYQLAITLNRVASMKALS